eukprot:SAG31_NODE_3352_length_4370_cov_3.025749_4_plen_320_part_00
MRRRPATNALVEGWVQPPLSPKQEQQTAPQPLPAQHQEQVIPRFFFPRSSSHVMDPSIAQQSRAQIDELFGSATAETTLDQEGLRQLTVQIVGLPGFMNSKLFERLASDSAAAAPCDPERRVSKAAFLDFWESELRDASPAGRIFHTLKRPGQGPTGQADVVLPEDFLLVLTELLDTHPGLEFLQTTKEFQSRYAETAIARIFYRLDRKRLGRLTLRDFERSTLAEAMQLVHQDDDINKELQYFSYEHFYVLYCKFWELDSDHDLEISRDELLRYGNHALTRRLVDRIFSQEPWPFSCSTPNKMGYHDFVWFALSEEVR